MDIGLCPHYRFGTASLYDIASGTHTIYDQHNMLLTYYPNLVGHIAEWTAAT